MGHRLAAAVVRCRVRGDQLAGRGGRAGASPTEQLIFLEETEKAHAPYVGVNFVGLLHAGPTLIAEASDEQKARHLPAILKGEQVWCQGFSEPGAGSDLASLRTRAVRDGDDYVISGQKIWTSFAQVADYCELLVRTSPDAEAPGHHLAHPPHGQPGHRDPAAPHHRRVDGVQRGVPRRVRVPVPTRSGRRTTAGGWPWSPSRSSRGRPSSARCSRPWSCCATWPRWCRRRTRRPGGGAGAAAGRPRRAVGADEAQRVAGGPDGRAGRGRVGVQAALLGDPQPAGRPGHASARPGLALVRGRARAGARARCR